MGPYRLGTTYALTVAAAPGSAVNTPTFGSHIRKIRVAATADCHIAIGPAATATSSDALMTAESVECFVTAQEERLSAIDVTGGSGGIVTVTELP